MHSLTVTACAWALVVASSLLSLHCSIAYRVPSRPFFMGRFIGREHVSRGHESSSPYTAAAVFSTSQLDAHTIESTTGRSTSTPSHIKLFNLISTFLISSHLISPHTKM